MMSLDSRSTVTAVLTSCRRFDLLDITLESFLQYNSFSLADFLIIEDSVEEIPKSLQAKYQSSGVKFMHTYGHVGQIAAIDYAYSRVSTPYIFHLEDDWKFHKSGFIEHSLALLQASPRCLQVWMRGTEELTRPIDKESNLTNGIRWRQVSFDYLGLYHGFSFNPGLRRLEDYVAINGYGQYLIKAKEESLHYEERIGIEYKRRNYYAAIIDSSSGYVRHIGDDRHVINGGLS